MADYNKYTVIQLRELFKTRNIPVTGLTRKQQLINRLLEEDQTQEAQEPSEAHADTTTQEQDDAPGSVDEVADAPETADDEDTREGSAEPEMKHPSAQPAQDETPNKIDSPIAPSEQTLAASQSENVEPSSRENTVSAELQVVKGDQPSESMTPQNESILQKPDESGLEVPRESEPLTASLSSTTSPAPEESKKRKRRSATPSISEEEVAQKKAKQEAEGAAVLLKEDLVSGEGRENPQVTAESTDGEPNEPPSDVLEVQSTPQIDDAQPSGADPESTATETQTEQQTLQPTEQEYSQNIDETIKDKPEPAMAASKLLSSGEKMYRHLKSDQTGHTASSGLDGMGEPINEIEDRDIAPAMHPATSALYIRDFMRPLRPDALETYLASLATGSKSQDGAVIRKFHLDGIRTHCFVVFATVSAASRVRSAIHDRVWPPEVNRKPLWADFAPEDKVQEWIEIETNAGSAGRGAGSKKWEVVYDRLEDGTVMASLQEASGAPLGPKRTMTQGSNTAGAPGPSGRPGAIRSDSAVSKNASQQPASFLALDSLFKSTSAKPKLYYMPVSKELASRRLSEMDTLTTKHHPVPQGGSGYPDSRRYTFENDDMLVDNGPEFGLRGRGPTRGNRGR